MTSNFESRLRRQEAKQSDDMRVYVRLIADPKQDAWAETDEGIAGEIARRQAAGLLPPGDVVVRLIVTPPARDQMQ